MTRVVILLPIMISAACASTGAVPRPFPGAPVPPPASPSPGVVAERPAPVGSVGTPLPADAYSLTATALTLRGIPYRNGGADPAGFDCSGFVSYVFGQHGVALPRTVGELYRLGTNPPGQLQPGDLVFFSTVAPGASHVGILIGGDEFVHAPSSSGVVRVERVTAPYWSSRYIGARRIL